MSDNQRDQTERFLLARVSFMGARYHGWQDQRDGSSVSEVLGAAMEHVLGRRPKLVAPSRTDSGVHALDMPVSFVISKRISLRGLLLGVNSHLPHDIRVNTLQEFDALVRPRAANRGKVYNYLYWNEPVLPANLHGHVWHLNQRLDWSRTEQARRDLCGRHDFSAFRASGCSSPDPVKSISSVELFAHPRNAGLKQLVVCGTGFLRHQVRIIAGTLMEIAAGRLEPDVCARMIEEGMRDLGGVTAPARGLHLVRVRLDLKKPMDEWPSERTDPMALFPLLEWTS